MPKFQFRLSSIVGAGASLMLSSALFAADACAPATCTPAGPNCQQCEQVFADAAAKLKNLDPGCCTPPSGCAAPSAGCTTDVCNPDAVFGGSSGCGEKEGLGDPWRLIDAFTDDCGKNVFKDAGWDFGGFTQFGYQDNPDGAFTGNGPFLSQYEWDRFNLNQQYMYIGKAADGSKGLDIGFRADLIYGVDGNEAQSFGNNPGEYDFLNGWDHGIYEWALPQLYAEVAYCDLSVKVGHFYTIVGYEVIPSNGNFFLSRQLTFYNSEPFTHTGALATYKASDKLTVWSGWTLGWDTGFDQFNGGNNFIGGFSYTMNEKASFIYTMTGGDLGWRGRGAVNSAILSYNWTDKLQTVHQFDVLGTDLAGADFATTGIARDSVGLINYAFYTVSDRVKLGARQEWYKADGISYYTYTYGVNFKPHANLTIRPEVRHMVSPGNDIAYPNGFNGGATSEDLFNQTVFGIDAILTF